MPFLKECILAGFGPRIVYGRILGIHTFDIVIILSFVIMSPEAELTTTLRLNSICDDV